MSRVPAERSGPARLLGFADESMRQLPDGSTVYVMAAAVLPEPQCEAVRTLMRGLLLPRQVRLHWRDEGQERRRKIVDAIAEAGVHSLVVVGARLDPARQERGRRQALRHLLWELDARSVEHLLLESRQSSQDRDDRVAIGGMRNARVVTRRLRVDHGRPVQEPLLWLPDAVCGAVGQARCGEPWHQAVIQERLEMIEVEID